MSSPPNNDLNFPFLPASSSPNTSQSSQQDHQGQNRPSNTSNHSNLHVQPQHVQPQYSYSTWNHSSGNPAEFPSPFTTQPHQFQHHQHQWQSNNYQMIPNQGNPFPSQYLPAQMISPQYQFHGQQVNPPGPSVPYFGHYQNLDFQHIDLPANSASTLNSTLHQQQHPPIVASQLLRFDHTATITTVEEARHHLDKPISFDQMETITPEVIGASFLSSWISLAEKKNKLELTLVGKYIMKRDDITQIAKKRVQWKPMSTRPKNGLTHDEVFTRMFNWRFIPDNFQSQILMAEIQIDIDKYFKVDSQFNMTINRLLSDFKSRGYSNRNYDVIYEVTPTELVSFRLTEEEKQLLQDIYNEESRPGIDLKTKISIETKIPYGIVEQYFKDK